MVLLGYFLSHYFFNTFFPSLLFCVQNFKCKDIDKPTTKVHMSSFFFCMSSYFYPFYFLLRSFLRFSTMNIWLFLQATNFLNSNIIYSTDGSVSAYYYHYLPLMLSGCFRPTFFFFFFFFFFFQNIFYFFLIIFFFFVFHLPKICFIQCKLFSLQFYMHFCSLNFLFFSHP